MFNDINIVNNINFYFFLSLLFMNYLMCAKILNINRFQFMAEHQKLGHFVHFVSAAWLGSKYIYSMICLKHTWSEQFCLFFFWKQKASGLLLKFICIDYISITLKSLVFSLQFYLSVRANWNFSHPELCSADKSNQNNGNYLWASCIVEIQKYSTTNSVFQNLSIRCYQRTIMFLHHQPVITCICMFTMLSQIIFIIHLN